MGEDRPTVAVFRPNDERLASATATIEDLGGDPLADPMLEVESTGAAPRTDADYVVLTSKTGVELATDAGWQPDDATVCAIGEATATALETAGYPVDVLPEVYTSRGLVERLADEVGGARVEVARSDHGSPVLIDGIEAAGAYVHETVLYRLVRPAEAGDSVQLAVAGELDAALFTSSLTVEHFLAIAAERGAREEAVEGLVDAVVGAIGPPTAETAQEAGVEVDVVPDTADFDALARVAMARL